MSKAEAVPIGAFVAQTRHLSGALVDYRSNCGPNRAGLFPDKNPVYTGRFWER